MKSLFLLTVIGIAFGSLYPFNFEFTVLGPEYWRALLDTFGSKTGRGDLLSNVILFLPFGYFGMLSLTRPRSLPLKALTVGPAGLMLAVALQAAQLYLPGRDANLQDVVWNLFGLGIGAGAALLPWLRPESPGGHWVALRTAPLLLMGSWFAYRLVPFIPSLDWQQIKNSLKPLLLNPSLSSVDVLHDTVAWLLVAHLWERTLPGRRGDRFLLLAIPAVFGLEVLIMYNRVSASSIVGAILAVLAWWGILTGLRRRRGFLLASLIAMLVVDGLAPFEPRLVRATFHWIPFYGFLSGSMFLNAAALFEKFFFYGCLVWMLRETGTGLRWATLFGVLVTFCIELGQIYFEFHTPEITDSILLVIAAMVIRAVDAPPNDRSS